MPTPSRSSTAARVGRAFLAVALGLAVCELGLRAAGAVYLGLTGRGGDAGGAGDVILCHGDSNVFGIYLPPQESYPGRLGRLLSESTPAPGHRVVNLGLPGINSSQVAHVLEEEIERYGPVACLVTVGANNAWAWTPDAAMGIVEPPWYEELRLVKLLRLLRHRLAGPQGAGRRPPHDDLEFDRFTKGAVRFSIRDREGREAVYESRQDRVFLQEDELAKTIRADVERMQAVCEDRGVRLILVCYGSDTGSYGLANRVLRDVAAGLGIELVDATGDLRRLVEREGLESVFFLDMHPAGNGYEVIARTVHDALIRLGLVDAAPVGDPLAGLSAADGDEPRIHMTGRLDGETETPAELAIEIEDGFPGCEFRMALWGLRDPGEPYEERFYEELANEDPLFRSTATAKRMAGTFDANGHGRIPVGRLLKVDRELLAGRLVQGAYVVYVPDLKPSLRYVSSSVELAFPALGEGAR